MQTKCTIGDLEHALGLYLEGECVCNVSSNVSYAGMSTLEIITTHYIITRVSHKFCDGSTHIAMIVKNRLTLDQVYNGLYMSEQKGW